MNQRCQGGHHISREEREQMTCQRKKAYPTRERAELDADIVALRGWEEGRDQKMVAYRCQACGQWHVGTQDSRRVQPYLIPLHEYEHLASPRPASVRMEDISYD